jgi:hypothetical protein
MSDNPYESPIRAELVDRPSRVSLLLRYAGFAICVLATAGIGFLVLLVAAAILDGPIGVLEIGLWLVICFLVLAVGTARLLLRLSV